MAKVLKILGRIVGISFEWVLLVLILFAFAIRTSQFQTYLGSLATNFLSKELNTELRIGKIDIVFFDKVYLKDVFVRDLHGDTLASLNQIMVRVKSFDPGGDYIHLKSVGLSKGRVGIERDTITGDYNYEFIADYFSGKKSNKPKSDPPTVTVDNVDIEWVTISYDDNRKGRNTYGMDYDHLKFKDVILHIEDFKEEKGVLAFRLEHLQTQEKCGFWLKHLFANAVINPHKGILLNKVEINTSRSNIYASKLNMLMSSMEGLRDFVDSVAFDAVIDSSRVSFWDISQFGTALEGMNEVVSLSAEVTKKVKDLKIDNLDLRFGKRSIVRGNYSLPDFRNLSASNFNQRIDYALIDFSDVEKIQLPKDAGQSRLKFSEMVDRLEYAQVRNTTVRGSTDKFALKSDKLQCMLGSVQLDNEITFTKLKEGGYSFNRTKGERYDIVVDSFNLAKFLDNPTFGNVEGQVYLSGVVGQKDMIRLETLEGEVTKFQFNNYAYSNITVSNGSFINNILDADLKVDDPNLKLAFNGLIDVSKVQHFDFKVGIEEANLGKLNFVKDPESSFVGNLDMDLRGNSLETYEGLINANGIEFVDQGKKMALPELSLYIERNPENDRFELRSDIIDADLSGKINFKTIPIAVNNGLSDAFPSYFSPKEYPRGVESTDHFELNATIKNSQDFLNIFVPKLEIAYGTVVKVELDSRAHHQMLDIQSSKISYEKLMNDKSDAYMTNMVLHQEFTQGTGTLTINAGKTQLRDSLDVENIQLSMDGTKNVYQTDLIWNKDVPNTSDFDFVIDVREEGEFDIQVKPSYFSVKNNRWDIMNTGQMVYQKKHFEIKHLMLERDNQYLAVNGVLSENPEDYLTIKAHELHVEEFSSLLGTGVKMQGSLDGTARLATPFTDIKIDGDFVLNDFILEGQEVGDVHVNGIWIDLEQKIILNGDLKYKDLQTFDFNGYVLPMKKEDNINFDLEFKDMNLSFVNAFMDPEVISDISGTLKGVIHATGSFDEPEIAGDLQLKKGGLRVGILGTHYSLGGPLKFDGKNDGIYGAFPVLDDEGNTAYAITTIFHNNFKDFSMSFDIKFDETVGGFRDPISKRPLSAPRRFMVLNTGYKEGTVYYGKAYATGTASILIEKGNTEITVDAKTEKDTEVNLPMYGAKEISEFDFIDFNTDSIAGDKEIDLTGVDLNLNIEATPDAKIKLILNDQTGEEISATGRGNIELSIDNQNHVAMSGRYVINSGQYLFVLNPLKKEFQIAQGSSITWTGSPEEANLDIKAYYKVNASLDELNRDQIGGSAETKSEVHCVLLIGQTLSNPSITLDIEVPNVSESGKAVLSKIRSDKDELQKQFFSLLAFNRFQGTGNNSNGSYGGVAEIITQKMNEAFDQLSKETKINVGYNDNTVTGDKNFQLGLQRAYGAKQNIVLKTSLGVSNNTTTGTAQNSLIGSFNLEYLINDDGTFRVSIFNESNDKGILSNKDKGEFTQGVGLHYEETFNNISESRIIEFFANLFRKENKVNNSKRKNRVPVDYIPGQSPAIPVEQKEEENNIPAGEKEPEPIPGN
ncbi:translocation/assembly module TamB domain-containing protein [Fluviicola sp.]|uniref:translocation/assembly module TamB domain-containing protein n=1 Tax=Fluviicola sp. TaxID=1917219 RepID=UPI0031E1819C